MSQRATAVAPANIAFVKYWGAHDLDRAIPLNPSISMTLSRCLSTCTVEARQGRGAAGEGDEVLIVGRDGPRPAPEAFAARVAAHLERLRQGAAAEVRFRVATRNSFPSGTGLASSASGFAALTVAATAALGQEPSTEELSILARRSGSGSAGRSVLGGYVELPSGPGEDDLFARALAPAEHWALCDVIAIVAAGPKSVSSLEGHRRAGSSPHFRERLGLLPARLGTVRQAIERRELGLLGPVLEEESTELHLIAMSSDPPIFYWAPGTVEVLEAVRRLRRDGIEAFSTMDAGPNVHVICQPEAEAAVVERLAELPTVREVIRDRVGPGPALTEEHLL